MSSLFTDLQKIFETICWTSYLIPFDIVGITTKVTTENLNALSLVCMNRSWSCFKPRSYIKWILQILLKVKIFGETHLWLRSPMGLILTTVSDFFHLMIWCQKVKIPPEKSPPWGVRDRVRVRLGIGIGLESGGIFSG